MLKSMVFQNMINFKDRQVLNFEKGVNFLIGANATGKSSILELIRRCHSKRLNSSSSNLQDKKKPGFIICKYENCSEALGDIAKDISGIERDVALLCHFQEKNISGSNIIYKCVCFRGKDREKEIYITVSCENHRGVINYDFIASEFDKFEDFFDIYFEKKQIEPGIPESAVELKLLDQIKLNLPNRMDLYENSPRQLDIGNPHSRLLAFILSFLNQLKLSFQNQKSVDDRSNFNTEMFLDPLSRAFAFIFADRSFGPLQWINGHNVGKLNAPRNYQEAQKRAEILWDLLPRDKDDTNESRSTISKIMKLFSEAEPESEYIDEEKEECYFNLMTYPLKYLFKKSSRKGKITVMMENDEREVEFLKAPEGVIESKQAALVFSHRKFKTICYEDIDRGMHDQMIENLNNLVLKKIEEKTVIIVTHNSSFMTGWAMERTHICSRQKSDKNLNIVTKVPSGYKFGVHEAMKKALFSARVLLVEGTTDMQILQPLFQYIIGIAEAQVILAKRLAKEQQTIVQQISKTQIIPFGGKRMGKAFEFLNAINIQVFTLNDTDKSPERIVANFKWKSGTIEEVLKNDCPKGIRNLVTEVLAGGEKEFEHLRKSKDKMMTKTYEECVSDGSYKDILKRLVKNGLKDDTYTEIYEELFQSIYKNDKQKDDDHKQKEENQKYHVQKDDKQEDNEQKDDDHKQKEENKKDHVQKDDKQEDNEQKDDDHKQKEENQKDPVQKDDKLEGNEQKDDDHKQQEENQKDHLQKDDKPEDNEQKDDDHKQKEENQKDHVLKDDKQEDNEQQDDDHKQKEENQKDHVQKDDKPEDNEQKDDDHKQKEENQKDHVLKDDKQEDNEQQDDDHKQKEQNQKDHVQKDDKPEDNEQKDDDHKQKEENQKDHVQKDDKPEDNEQKDDGHKQKEENQKDHVQKDDKPEDNEQKDDGHKQKEENQKDHVQKDDKPENNEQKDDKENDDKQVDHEQKAAKKNEDEENVDKQNNVKQKDDSQQKENKKNENDDKRKDDEQEDNKQMVIDMLEFLNFIINRP